MDHIKQTFSVKFEYNVFFTSSLFDTSNRLLADFFAQHTVGGSTKKLLFVIDEGVLKNHPDLTSQIKLYFKDQPGWELIDDIIVLPGGEVVKNEDVFLQQLLSAVNTHKIDRHSYLIAIGGGSLLDVAGYAAAIAHRGIKHSRVPTTVLSQNDSGVGVKNSVNYFGKKNFLGTFTPPVAVFNDDIFLKTLTQRDWIAGMSEAVKVALINDAQFFNWLENHATDLVNRDLKAMNELIKRCAQLHVMHIGGTDPFERGSLRPLDFGHWSAHKLEQLSNFDVLHGEAVAMGIALDTIYSNLAGLLPAKQASRIIHLLQKLDFELTHPLMSMTSANSEILAGLQEFREHLGGQLTIMLLENIGQGIEVHEIDISLMRHAELVLHNFDPATLNKVKV